MSNKTTPTDKVRAALEAANRCIENGPDYTILEGSAYHKMIRQALSELSGKVLVPVEPTVAMGLAWNKAAMDCASYFSTAYYKAMIKPYIKDE